MMNRRDFLKAIGLASTAPLWVRFNPLGAEAAEGSTVETPNHLLLVLYLAGGNDGLNTVVPYLDPAYAVQRPQLALRETDVRPIGDGFGLHGSLKHLHNMWTGGQLAVVHNVGYPSPNFSHVESTYIWETGSPEMRFHTGWLGRYLDATDGSRLGAVRAVAAGIGSLPRTLVGEDQAGVTLDSVYDFAFADRGRPDAALRHSAFGGFGAGRNDDGSMHSKVLEAQSRMVKAVDAVARVVPSLEGVDTPAETVAAMFAAGVGTEIGFIEVAGFDTHTTQRGTHAGLLAQADQAVAAFFDRARAFGVADRATVVTFSDFGRRVGENASGGTDHGSSMPILVAGPRVRGGVYGQRPDLSRLVDGNLTPTIHLGSVYASILSDALRVDPAPILGREFPTLPLIG